MNMPFLSRHDIRTWVGMPNAQQSESHRACRALKLKHEPYDGRAEWDWVATELFRTLFSKRGGYVVDSKRDALSHMRGQISTPYMPEKRDREALFVVPELMILYKEQWWIIYERKS